MVSRSRRPGFTLFEILLVAAVLVLLGAIIYPSLKNSYGYYKLHGGVDAVRAAWAHARARAVEEGRPYRFSVEPNGSRFRVAPDAPDYWSGSAPSGDRKGKGLILEQALPGGVRFTVGATPGPAPDDRGLDSTKEATTPSSGIDWNTAVVFLPDGTAKDDVSIIFQVRGVKPTRLLLRGLTGTASVQTVSK